MEVTRNRSLVLFSGLAAAGCLGAGWIAHLIQPLSGSNVSWRPGAGLLLGLLLLRPRQSWGWIGLAAFLAEIYVQRLQTPLWGVGLCSIIAAIHVVGTLIAAWLMSRTSPDPIDFDRLQSLYYLILFPCALVAAIGCAVEISVLRGIAWNPLTGHEWFRWWVRDWLGYFLVAPVVVTLTRFLRSGVRWRLGVVVRLLCLTGLTLCSAWFAFRTTASSNAPLEPQTFMPPLTLAYLPFPALVWAALRFRPAGAAATCLVLAIVVILQTTRGQTLAPAILLDQTAAVRWMQLYLLISSGMTLILATVFRERDKSVLALAESERRARSMAEDLRIAERERKTMEDLYRRAIAAANAVPYLRDYRSETFTFIGEGILELSGYSSSEITAELWDSLALEQVMRGDAKGLSLQEAVRRTRAGDFRHWQSDALILTRNGQKRWIADSSVEVLDEANTPIGSIGILMDVTERKRAEEAVRRENEGLEGRINERTLELEAAVHELEAFTYSVSHDLRTPLRAIEGFSRILQEDHGHEMSLEGSRLLSRVRGAAVRMDLLINNLLSFSRLNRETILRQNTDLNVLVKESFEELRHEMGSREIQIQHHDLPTCHGDPALLRQVILNLLSNALKYTRKRDVAVIEVGWESQEGEIVYYVRDNGTGFDMAYVDKLFGVFQRLHRAEEFEGNGVGLAIAQRIIRRHEGRVWAQGEVECGATFYFTVGVRPATAPSSKMNPAQEGFKSVPRDVVPPTSTGDKTPG